MSYSEADDLDAAFEKQKQHALEYIHTFNAKLPSAACPGCGDEGHVPGLKCPVCGYRHPIAWAILRDTEFGYDAVALTQRARVYQTFNVDC